MDIKSPSDRRSDQKGESPFPSWVYVGKSLPEPISFSVPAGEIAFYLKKGEFKAENEDSVLVVDLGQRGLVLAIADGVGGHAHGGDASKIAIETLHNVVQGMNDQDSLRTTIVKAFDESNRKILETFDEGATTLIVVEVNAAGIRIYFAGDSLALIASGRGRLKYRIYGHNPVDYGILAGAWDDSNYNPLGMRHMVTNIVGSVDMQIQLGSLLELSPQDTLVLGSDGLFDNLPARDIASLLGTREFKSIAQIMKDKVLERMKSSGTVFAKPDDLSFIVFRPRQSIQKKSQD